MPKTQTSHVTTCSKPSQIFTTAYTCDNMTPRASPAPAARGGGRRSRPPEEPHPAARLNPPMVPRPGRVARPRPPAGPPRGGGEPPRHLPATGEGGGPHATRQPRPRCPPCPPPFRGAPPRPLDAALSTTLAPSAASDVPQTSKYTLPSLHGVQCW